MEVVKANIKALYEQRKKYIEESNYIKAEEISKKINNYKSMQIKKQQREFIQRQEEEQNNFDKNYSEELSLFRERWSKKEENENAVSVRAHGQVDMGSMGLDAFAKMINEKVKEEQSIR